MQVRKNIWDIIRKANCERLFGAKPKKTIKSQIPIDLQKERCTHFSFCSFTSFFNLKGRNKTAER